MVAICHVCHTNTTTITKIVANSKADVLDIFLTLVVVMVVRRVMMVVFALNHAVETTVLRRGNRGGIYNFNRAPSAPSILENKNWPRLGSGTFGFGMGIFGWSISLQHDSFDS